MATTWYGEAPPPPSARIGPAGWLRVLGRGLPMALVVFGGLGVHLVLRLVERAAFGARRPWTPWLAQAVCRTALAILGLRVTMRGQPPQGPGAVVANHSSWLDIFVLNAAARVYFVAKAEVAGWPGIGWLAQATGTLFIRRDRRDTAAQQALFRDRLAQGHRLLFFPEGTSTDGKRVLRFHSTLFEPFLGVAGLTIQPATVVYRTPPGVDPRFYGWWGDMAFGPHLLQVLAAPRQGSVDLIWQPALVVEGFSDRKALAMACEGAVRGGLDGSG